jgi:hypothetical protein
MTFDLLCFRLHLPSHTSNSLSELSSSSQSFLMKVFKCGNNEKIPPSFSHPNETIGTSLFLVEELRCHPIRKGKKVSLMYFWTGRSGKEKNKKERTSFSFLF